MWVGRVGVPRGTYLCFLRFPACALRCLLACLAVDPDGHGAVVCQGYLHIGAEATCANGAPESLLEGANDLVIEGFGYLGAGSDVVGIHSQFVHRLPDEEEGGDPIIDLFFLFVEQVFAEYPFLVGFLRLQRYEFLVWGGCLLWVRGLFCCLFHVERVLVLVLPSTGVGVLLLVFHVEWRGLWWWVGGFSRVRIPYIEIVA